MWKRKLMMILFTLALLPVSMAGVCDSNDDCEFFCDDDKMILFQ